MAARFSGTQTVRSGDDLVTYRTDAEMKAAIDALDILIARMDGATPVRQVRIASSKGL